LTGAGGTGKSRLAIQIGLEMLNHFKDGVYLVMLEPISDPDLVISTIAETLGIRESPGSQPIGEMLKEYLRDKQILLLLDNFEQVVEAAPSVAELLEACPKLKCIATSRAPLRLRVEKELPVPPLTVPSLQKFNKLENLSQYAAVELFIQRAQAVKPDFSVTNANAPAVGEVCYRLDGLPLAIELAAARIKLLTPQGLLTRLENRFELLRGGTRDLPERQRTLRSAIDWSYNLLNEGEKKLFRRLSIFVGGWTLEAAETVCDINGDLAKNLDDTLSSLIDNNLVIQLQEYEDEPRFGMLSTIHEYAIERLNEID
jgi:predicted ATPase